MWHKPLVKQTSSSTEAAEEDNYRIFSQPTQPTRLSWMMASNGSSSSSSASESWTDGLGRVGAK